MLLERSEVHGFSPSDPVCRTGWRTYAQSMWYPLWRWDVSVGVDDDVGGGKCVDADRAARADLGEHSLGADITGAIVRGAISDIS